MSLVIAVKQKSTHRFRMADMMFYILQNSQATLAKVAYFRIYSIALIALGEDYKLWKSLLYKIHETPLIDSKVNREDRHTNMITISLCFIIQ